MGAGGRFLFFIFLTALKNRSMLEYTLNTLKLSCQTELNDIYIKYPLANEIQVVLGKNVGIQKFIITFHSFSTFFFLFKQIKKFGMEGFS